MGRRGAEETGRTRKMSRYAGTGASTFAPACTHQQPPSRHPTPPAAAIHTSQGLRTSSCSTVSPTTTYGPHPYYVSHQHTHLPPLTVMCGPEYSSPVPARVWAWPSSTAKVPPRYIRRGPAAAAAATPPLPTSPNTTTVPPTSTHQTHQHLALTLPLHYPRYIQGQRLGSSPGR